MNNTPSQAPELSPSQTQALAPALLALRKSGIRLDQTTFLKKSLVSAFYDNQNLIPNPNDIIDIALEIREQISADDRTIEPTKEYARKLREVLLKDEVLRLNANLTQELAKLLPHSNSDEIAYVVRRIEEAIIALRDPGILRAFHRSAVNFLLVPPVVSTPEEAHQRISYFLQKNPPETGNPEDSAANKLFYNPDQIYALLELDQYGALIIPRILNNERSISYNMKIALRKLLQAIQERDFDTMRDAIKSAALRTLTFIRNIQALIERAEISCN